MDPIKKTLSAQRQSANDDQDAIEDEEIVIAFQIGRTGFSAPIQAVQEVVETGQVAAFPIPHEGIIGLLNLRGTLVPLLMPAIIDESIAEEDMQQDAAHSRFVVLDTGLGAIGVRATDVRKLFVEASRLRAAESSRERRLAVGDKLFVLVDLEAILERIERYSHAA